MTTNLYMPPGLSLITDEALRRMLDALESLHASLTASDGQHAQLQELEKAIQAIRNEREKRAPGFGIDKADPE